MLGLPRDSWSHPASLFYEGGHTHLGLSEIDKAVLKLLYDPRVKSGMTLAEFEILVGD